MQKCPRSRTTKIKKEFKFRGKNGPNLKLKHRKAQKMGDPYRRAGDRCHIGGFHVTSSPPCWWTVNKRSLITSLCLSTSICSFHHCYLCLPRLHENHLLYYSFAGDLRSVVYVSLLQQKMSRYSLRVFWSLGPLRACLHGGGGPQAGEITCGGSCVNVITLKWEIIWTGRLPT